MTTTTIPAQPWYSMMPPHSAAWEHVTTHAVSKMICANLYACTLQDPVGECVFWLCAGVIAVLLTSHGEQGDW